MSDLLEGFSKIQAAVVIATMVALVALTIWGTWGVVYGRVTNGNDLISRHRI